jgi:hypothetical protein
MYIIIKIIIEETHMKFKAKPWKSGDSYVVVIPKAFIDNEMLDTNKEYEFVIEEE